MYEGVEIAVDLTHVGEDARACVCIQQRCFVASCSTQLGRDAPNGAIILRGLRSRKELDYAWLSIHGIEVDDVADLCEHSALREVA